MAVRLEFGEDKEVEGRESLRRSVVGAGWFVEIYGRVTHGVKAFVLLLFRGDGRYPFY